jgi:hypothetical protein
MFVTNSSGINCPKAVLHLHYLEQRFRNMERIVQGAKARNQSGRLPGGVNPLRQTHRVLSKSYHDRGCLIIIEIQTQLVMDYDI